MNDQNLARAIEAAAQQVEDARKELLASRRRYEEVSEWARRSLDEWAHCAPGETFRYEVRSQKASGAKHAWEQHLAHAQERYQAATELLEALRGDRDTFELYANVDPPTRLVLAVRSLNQSMISYIRRHPQAMHDIHWHVFEELIAELLASFGWQVDLTRLSRDGGYDIFAVHNTAGLRSSWIIECKHYKAERKVGIEIARSLYAVKTELHVGMAMLATTSCFTEGVKDFSASRYDFELRDFEGILEWINEYRPNPNGRLYIKDQDIAITRSSRSKTT